MKPNKILFLPLLLPILLSLTAVAQERLSYRDALRIAAQQNPRLVMKRLALSQEESRYKEAWSEKLPQLSASADVQRNIDIATTPIPAYIMDPSADRDQIFPARFGTKYSGNAGLHLDFDLFNPDTYGAVSAAKLKRSMAELEAETAQQLMQNNVALAYVTARIAQEQSALAEEDTLLSASQLSYLLARKAEGQATEEDLLLHKQSHNRSLSRRLAAENVLLKAKQKLLQQMGLSPTQFDPESLTLSTGLDSLLQQEGAVLAAVAMPSRIGDEIDRLQVRVKALELKKSQLAFLPSLSLRGFYGGSYYDAGFEPFQKDHWYRHSYIGIQMSLPITGLLTRAHALSRERAAYRTACLEAKEKQLSRDAEMAHYRSDADAAAKDLGLKKENLLLAKQVYAMQEAKWKEGELLYVDFLKAKYEYQKSYTEYLQTIYDYFAALVKIQIAALSS